MPGQCMFALSRVYYDLYATYTLQDLSPKGSSNLRIELIKQTSSSS
jgi:hypothetical protein